MLKLAWDYRSKTQKLAFKQEKETKSCGGGESELVIWCSEY